MISFFRKLGWLTERRRKEDELREELQFHLDEEAEQRQAEGLAKDQARWAACRDLGNVLLIQESTRAVWTWTFFEQLVQDLRYALRAMIHNRAFTALAALSLALGIGANTAIYSFLDALLLRSLPVSDPASLVVLNWRAKVWRGDSVVEAMSGSIYDDSRMGSVSGIFPYPAFELLQNSDTVFSEVFAYCRTQEVRTMNVTIKGQADLAHGELVSGDYFRGLAVRPAAGRLIIPDYDRTGAAAVAVVSHAFSEKHFGGAGSAVGQTILINNLPFTVVGVTPPEFFPTSVFRCTPTFCLALPINSGFEPMITSTKITTGLRSWLDCAPESVSRRPRPRWRPDFSNGWRPPPRMTASGRIFLR